MHIITIDGYSGTGKGSIASILANRLHYKHYETGLYYRAVAYLMLKNNIRVDEEDEIIKLYKDNMIGYKDDKFLINGNEEIDLRSIDVTNYAAKISNIKALRLHINEDIKELSNDNIVIDGRDVAINIFPEAEVKVLLYASLDSRALRRYKQAKEMGLDITLKEVYNLIKERDIIDETRDYGSLKDNHISVVIDTTSLTIDEVVEKILDLVRSNT